MDELYYDPYDYEIDADPHPIWKRMRDEQPLYYNEKFDFFAVSRYADVRDLSVDWRTFSSHQGSVLELIKAPPEVIEQARNMLFEDPPIHDVHRSILARTFTPRRINGLEPRIRELCSSFLEPFIGAGGFDYVRDYGARLPMMVISSLLGVPEPDQEYVRSLADATVHRDEGETEWDAGPQLEMQRYFADLVAERRKRPTEDLISALTHAEVEADGGGTRKLADDELLRYISLVAAAGNETVANLMGWSGVLLARHPDQRQVLVDDPGVIPNAVEELLRYEAPSPVQARLVTRDVELYGETVPAGSAMVLITGSAGRDERAYDDPDRFDVRRSFENHVSFGHGIHYCLGAALARLEGRVGLEELLRRFPTWEVDEDKAEMVHTSTVRGWATLPVTV